MRAITSSDERAVDTTIRLKNEDKDEEGVRGAQPDLYSSTASQRHWVCLALSPLARI